MARIKTSHAFALGFLLWAGALLLALNLGAVNQPDWELMVQLRIPRILLASAVGIGLSVAGAALQALFSNPLCEPYTLGVSSGAALGAAIGTSLGFQWIVSGLAMTAFLGALAFATVLYSLSSRTQMSSVSLLLAGVMLSFLGSGLLTLWVFLFDTEGFPKALFWLFGDLSRARLQGALLTFGFVLLISSLVWGKWRSLDGLLMGEEKAFSIGVDVPSTRKSIILQTSLLVGVCVSAGGIIGFIGLIIPHLARRVVGSLHFKLLPFSALLGATSLVLADCLSRFITRPYELPVGVITSLIGAPFFMSILLKRRGVSQK